MMISPGASVKKPGELGDDLRYFPDHLIKVALLTQLAIDLEPDVPVRRVADRLGWHDFRNRRGVLEGLGCSPGLPGFLRFGLQVAAGEIDTDAIAEDVVRRYRDRNVGTATAQGNDQLDLVMHVGRKGRVGEILTRQQQIVRVL